MLGGALWVAWSVFHALQPMGCVGDECDLPGQSMREGSALGSALLLAAVLIQAILFAGDFWDMPYFVIPALLALVVGFLLLGWAILRSGVLLRWCAALLIAGTLALLGMNEQTVQVLLAIPFGVAWAVLGAVLWSRRDGAATAAPVTG